MSLAAAPLADAVSHAGLARAGVPHSSLAASVAAAGVSAVVLMAPFEALQPFAVVRGQSLSTVEAIVIASLAAWLLAAARSGCRPIWRTPLAAPWIALIAAMLVSALLAPQFTGNALNMTGRMTAAFAVYLMTVNAATSWRRIARLTLVVVVSGVLVWPLMMFEYAGLEAVRTSLSAFRTHAANVGGVIRASGPFQYPTIASMYLEIVFALALGLLVAAVDARKAGGALLAGVVAVGVGQAITLTFSRAGLGLMLVALVVVGWHRVGRRGFDAGTQALVAVAALVALMFPATRSVDVVGLRFTTEAQGMWFRASFDAPVQLTIPAGRTIAVPVTVTNTGRSAWISSSESRFRLSYHWLLDDNRVISWQNLRTDFPGPVRPGESVHLAAQVEAPGKAGQYRLLWDVERENWIWFSTEPGATPSVSAATVTGPDAGPLGTPSNEPVADTPQRPGRAQLWRAALRMFAARPISGVGPDNFRLVYGPYAGLLGFDERIHSNNMYLEVLAGTGLIGVLAFAWLGWKAAAQAVTLLRAGVRTPLGALAGALAAATAAIALHGLVDSFLNFSATYILIAVTLGLTTAAIAQGDGHAHRV